jgi:hypothetical protein
MSGDRVRLRREWNVIIDIGLFSLPDRMTCPPPISISGSLIFKSIALPRSCCFTAHVYGRNRLALSSNQPPAARTEVKQGEFFNCRRIDAHSFYSHSQGLRFGTLLTAVAATAAVYRD